MIPDHVYHVPNSHEMPGEGYDYVFSNFLRHAHGRHDAMVGVRLIDNADKLHHWVCNRSGMLEIITPRNNNQRLNHLSSEGDVDRAY